METKTHWKKNVDSRYISGEDLLNGEAIGKGLRPEMVVKITKHSDADAFDQGTKSSVKKTALELFDMKENRKVYKPLLLNKTLVDFFRIEFESEFIEDWFEKPFVLFAKPDSRHGHVARVRKHKVTKPKIADLDKAKAAIQEGKITAEQIMQKYDVTPEQEKELRNA